MQLVHFVLQLLRCEVGLLLGGAQLLLGRALRDLVQRFALLQLLQRGSVNALALGIEFRGIFRGVR